MDQYSWSDFPEMPYIFSSSPTPSDCSRCPPQLQHHPYDSISTSFDESQFSDSPTLYVPPCAAISPPLVAGDVLDAFNPPNIYSANISLPSTGQTQPRPQFVFGGIQSPFAFNIDHFLPTAVHQNHPPSQVASLPVLGPPAASTDEASFSPNSQLGDLASWACPTPSEFTSESTLGGACEEGVQVPAVVPRPQPLQRSSTRRSSRKRKTSQSDSDDGSVRAPLNLSQKMLKHLGLQRLCFNAA
jgi:hypothetical protein